MGAPLKAFLQLLIRGRKSTLLLLPPQVEKVEKKRKPAEEMKSCCRRFVVCGYRANAKIQ